MIEEKEKKVKELQDNVAAVNFNANSRMGKMLMAKCRTLQEENEEIGALASEGKVCMSSILYNSLIFFMHACILSSSKERKLKKI